MLKEVDSFYLNQKEPYRSIFLSIRDLILSLDTNITDSIKYRMPFFSYKKKMFCYFWIDKKTEEPYIGFVEGKHLNSPSLEKGNRSRMKIFRIHLDQDLPMNQLQIILHQALDLYRKGILKT